MVSTLVAFIVYSYRLFRKEQLSSALARAVAASIGCCLIIFGMELGEIFVSDSFGDFLGKFVFRPAGVMALIVTLPEEPSTPIVKLFFKCGFLGWQIVLGLLEAYTGGSENTAMIALGIGVTLAMFEFIESIPSFLRESMDLHIQRREKEEQGNRK